MFAIESADRQTDRWTEARSSPMGTQRRGHSFHRTPSNTISYQQTGLTTY